MKHTMIFLYQYAKGVGMTRRIQKHGSTYYRETMKQYCGKKILNYSETSKFIIEKLNSGEPFMVCRFGANELAALRTFDFENTSKYAEHLSRLHTYAGFFPENARAGKKFSELMIHSIPEADLIGIWPQPFEEYYLKNYGSEQLNCTWLKGLEPWQNPSCPWTIGLKGKKVLVIHPFSESIRAQYLKRESLFPDTDILPEFDLQVFQSVQTSGGSEDNRFDSWSEALTWMENEILKLDFDVAIIGCGAYGFPLASALKRAGKQAIHIGGITQLLFGIMGSRWENNPDITKYVNDAWVRPSQLERPKDADKIENACYW